MKCPVCCDNATFVFTATVLAKHEAPYYVCSNCGYIHAKDPYWLDEAYSNAIASSDTGLMSRNISIASKLAAILYWGFGERGSGRYVDVAGGYGVLTRLMRDFGFDFYWEDKYCTNLVASGFEYDRNSGECNGVTAFEVLEHLENPVEFIRNSLQQKKAGTFIFSTELYPSRPPKPDEWAYYSFPTGQHIGFFSKKTLLVIGKMMNMHFYSANGIHLLTTKPFGDFKLRLLTGRFLSALTPIWTRRNLGSKTTRDSEYILKLLDPS